MEGSIGAKLRGSWNRAARCVSLLILILSGLSQPAVHFSAKEKDGFAPPNADGLPPAELQQLLLKLLEENAEQRRVIAELRDDTARLKGLKGPPRPFPS